MTSIKTGAKINGLTTHMVLAIFIADQVYSEMGYDCVITEGTGGKHGTGSLHYVGNAVDLRTRDIPNDIITSIVRQITVRLGDQFDVVLEKTHLHVEYQPK